jgi:hypothetical protein
MRLLRGLAGTLLWIVAALLGLVALILCATIILLPVGLPLLGYVPRLFALSFKLVLPHAVSHPLQAADKSMHKSGRKNKKQLVGAVPDLKNLRKRGRDTARRVRKRAPIPS